MTTSLLEPEIRMDDAEEGEWGSACGCPCDRCKHGDHCGDRFKQCYVR